MVTEDNQRHHDPLGVLHQARAGMLKGKQRVVVNHGQGRQAQAIKVTCTSGTIACCTAL